MRADVEPASDRTAAERLRDALRFSPLEIVVLGVLVLLVGGGATLAWARSRPLPLDAGFAAAPGFVVTPSGSPDAAASTTTIMVHVVGAVRRPGVFELPAGSRGIDAVRAAGGLTRRADPLAINLAKPLSDGEQLIVPDRAAEPASPRVGSGSGGSSAADASGLVNVNTADQAELETLPGIGPALAQRIIEHRETNGPFATLDDLLEVSGIGEKTLENLEPYVTVWADAA